MKILLTLFWIPHSLSPLVLLDLVQELLGQVDLAPDVRAQPLLPVQAHDEPHLERAKPPPQRDVPVAVVWDSALKAVLQVERVHVEGVYDGGGVSHPHARAVKVHQQPLVRIEVERVAELNAVQQRSGDIEHKISSLMLNMHGTV